ncbi:MAG: alpha/beta hydrolase [Anaerolineae bacterium]
MTRTRWFLMGVAFVLILFSWSMVAEARRGLIVRHLTRDGVPMIFLAPVADRQVPGVLVAHGFAGSKQLMLGYGYTFARAGYAVLLWDFGGHGANGNHLERIGLQRDIELAYATLVAQPETDPGRVALVGHSMGSGAVMTAGVARPDRYAAVVAISPTGAEVTPDAPHNLLLEAGSWEGRFVANAERLLQSAGGPNDDIVGGRARKLVLIPNAEHISILFRHESHAAALDWLGATFGTPRATSYVDRRIIWYGLHLVAWLLVLVAVAPAMRSGLSVAGQVPAWRRWTGLLLGPAVAAAVLGLLGRFFPLQNLGGLVVGGAVGLWLLIAGLVWLALVRPSHAPAPAGLLLGILCLGFLVAAFGIMAQSVWVQWWLIGPRLWRWPLLGLACLPWFLAAGFAQWGASARGRTLWWAGQSSVLVGGLLVTLALVPALGFLVLLMPLLPVILAILAVAAAAFDRPWPYALGSAFFFGWVLAAVFPLD